jgi:hypothetical protein
MSSELVIIITLGDAGLTVDQGRRSWRMGWAGQAALAVLGGLFLGFLAGLLSAG